MQYDDALGAAHIYAHIYVTQYDTRNEADDLQNSSFYSNASQGCLNKLTVAYNKGLRIYIRSLKTTTILAVENVAGSLEAETEIPSQQQQQNSYFSINI